MFGILPFLIQWIALGQFGSQLYQEAYFNTHSAPPKSHWTLLTDFQKLPEEEIELFLPQICSMILDRGTLTDDHLFDYFEQLLVNKCADCFPFGLRVCSLLKASMGSSTEGFFKRAYSLPAHNLAGNGPQFTAQQREQKLRHLTERTEYATAHGTPKLSPLVRQHRKEYYADCQYLLDSLARLGSELRSFPVAQRDAHLRNGLSQLNSLLSYRMLTQQSICSALGRVSLQDTINSNYYHSFPANTHGPQYQQITYPGGSLPTGQVGAYLGPRTSPHQDPSNPFDATFNFNFDHPHFNLQQLSALCPSAAMFSLHLPMQHSKEKVCRILRFLESESEILPSKDRTPYLVVVELLEQPFECKSDELYTEGRKLDDAADEGRAMPTIRHTLPYPVGDHSATTVESISSGAFDDDDDYDVVDLDQTEGTVDAESAAELFGRDEAVSDEANVRKVYHSQIRGGAGFAGMAPGSGPRHPHPSQPLPVEQNNHRYATQSQYQPQPQPQQRGQFRSYPSQPQPQPQYPPQHHQYAQQDADRRQFPDSPPSRNAGQMMPGQMPPAVSAVSSSRSSMYSEIPHPVGIVRPKTWNEKRTLLQSMSPFGHLPGYTLRSFIVKSGDDLRKEMLAMQLLRYAKKIFEVEGLDIYLRPYDILSTGYNSGWVEYIDGAISIDRMKKLYKDEPSNNQRQYLNRDQQRNAHILSLTEYFQLSYGPSYSVLYNQAAVNFVKSLVGYSLFTYVVQVKDRHNANLMIDSEGHIVHIDFGFILGDSPGFNLNFESAPFKLTKEYIDLIGGIDSPLFHLFEDLFLRGFLALQKHIEGLSAIVQLFYNDTSSSSGGDNSQSRRKGVVDALRSRLLFPQSHEDILSLIGESMDNWRTKQYDWFQQRSNNIQM